ncbi:hypothetical protein [Ruminococcus sp.]|uniref:hypothetical protein n=1 Tax=Ruminococcus sp. TaxID=41978 RepID=UPI0038675F33
MGLDFAYAFCSNKKFGQPFSKVVGVAKAHNTLDNAKLKPPNSTLFGGLSTMAKAL